jgi:type I restriction enzyme R subunit
VILFTGMTSLPKPMNEFPTPVELQKRYVDGMGFSLESEAARPLLVKYTGGEAQRRYYQDAAIRAVFEKIAQGKNRALLSLATGAGKTFIAVNMLRSIADAGQLKKTLFICDRDELRTQALSAFQGLFGTTAASVENKNPQKNARVIIAAYQSVGISKDDDDAGFLVENYPEGYFSHIVIDECHRSAWRKWSQVLTRNTNAIQIGLTATPRSLIDKERTPEALADEKITADNANILVNQSMSTIEELMQHIPRNALPGEYLTEIELKKLYEKTDYEAKIQIG